MIITRRSVSFFLISLVAGGCAEKSPLLFQWESYQGYLDSYFRTDSVGLDTQIQLMEQDLQKIKAIDSAVPPGYTAHLGLLYAQQGRLDKFSEFLMEEKRRFPEAEVFVDFLLRNFKK
jgi:hypothetical protein